MISAAQVIFPDNNQWSHVPEPYLEDGLHVWSYEARGVGHQMTKHTSALLLVPANTTVLQLR